MLSRAGTCGGFSENQDFFGVLSEISSANVDLLSKREYISATNASSFSKPSLHHMHSENKFPG